MSRPGVMLYFDMLPAMKRLNRENKADLIEALLEYAQYGSVPDFDSDALAVAWDFIQPRIDKDAEAYEQKCLKNQYSVYCREAKKNGLEPMIFEGWKERKTSTDIGRYQPIKNDTEIETQTHTQKETQMQNEGCAYFDNDSFEAKREEALRKLFDRGN